jgi:RNA polymerase sigma-70 factor (ECF subfamily)
VAERTRTDLQEERRLIEAAQRDRQAFGALYDRYFDRIFSYAYYHTGSRERAEDIAAATFQQGLEGIAQFEWREIPYVAWLYRVAANLIAKERRRPAWVELDNTAESSDETPEEVWLRREQGNELQALVRELPIDQRQAILLKFEGRLRNKEIGVIMNRSEGAVKLLTFRALHALRRKLIARNQQRGKSES